MKCRVEVFRNDRWCSCEHSSKVNEYLKLLNNGGALLARVAFPKVTKLSRSRAIKIKREEGIGDFGNSAYMKVGNE